MHSKNDPSPIPVKRIRLLRWLWKLPLVFMVVTSLQVLTLRFVDPWFSSFMAIRQVEAVMQGEWSFRVAYDWRDLDKMAPSLPLSMVAAEDQNFATHHGFDLDAIEKARVHNRKMVERAEKRGRPVTRLRGASTISQQVAKNLFLWQGSHRVTRWARKGLEAWYTVLIEALWPKSRILEVYANIAEFGDGVYGGQAAARRYWGKDAARLTPAESARLAAVLPSPRRYSAAKPGPYVQRRAKRIQRQVVQIGGTAYLEALR
ncbi:monofunctional biosynthetic peptidoglycan transglycosylase [Pseudoxanthomonas mexicana]|jgi:monofunctional biosynthetic peptidoglycan transglycosylase|uniref:monofunctional biosynthetic peptidoglycan transglycosylase n=1 Tax=Pseudoxanthomonas mexicana TaxID=128785 RepID=UPI0028AB5F1A|nr:monofunctional biosynthetic peptidoglycan transglycosylase [Pseudoxanthomonas mexicana]